jgi:hypothetical protein
VNLLAQCPDTGETKVIRPIQGTGYRFYKFIGDSSYVYFLDGKKFSFDDKGDPGKTFIFIDYFAYEPIFVQRTDLDKSYLRASCDQRLEQKQIPFGNDKQSSVKDEVLA